MATRATHCVYCLCNDTALCESGCSWVEDPAGRAICSSCADSEDVATRVWELILSLSPRAKPPIAVEAPVWADLGFPNQQLLVMAHKRLIERAYQAMGEELSDQAFAALLALQGITQFIHERAPQHLQDDRPIEEVVMQLLEPQLGSRIILPGSDARV